MAFVGAVEGPVDPADHPPPVVGALELPTVGGDPLHPVGPSAARPHAPDGFVVVIPQAELGVAGRHRDVAVDGDERRADQMGAAVVDEGLVLCPDDHGADLVPTPHDLGAGVVLAVGGPQPGRLVRPIRCPRRVRRSSSAG